MVLYSLLETLTELNVWAASFRLILAAIIGGCIGSERGKHGRAAGLRTHILVCVGAVVTMLVGLYSSEKLGYGTDPMRISAQVISGIGFLGAGTILHHHHSQVTGLTTAAGLWTTACIGLAIGIGAYWVAILAFIIMMITMVLLIRLEHFRIKATTNTYYLELNDVNYVNEFSQKIKDFTYTLQIVPAKSGLSPHVGLLLTTNNSCNEDEIFAEFERYDYVIVALSVSV